MLYDRAKMTVSGTPGTGTITLGSAVTDATNGDCLSFANAGVSNGEMVSYVVIDGHNWGKGRGTYTSSGTTLSRDSAEVTWNGSSVGSTPISLSSSAVVMISALAADLTNLGLPAVIAQDQKASGTGAQSLTGSTWNVRTLNTIVRNVGSIASLSSNQITLTAGTYLLIGRAPMQDGTGSKTMAKLRFYNVTDSAAIGAAGESVGGISAVDSATGVTAVTNVPRAEVTSPITLTSSKTIRLEMYVSGSATGGVAISAGDVEVYATVLIFKVG